MKSKPKLCKCGCQKPVNNTNAKYLPGHSNRCEEVKRKKREAYYQRTGYANPSQKPDIKQKKAETTLNKYGDKNYNNPGVWIRRALRKGITITACERCSEARDLTEEMIIEGVKITGFYPFITLLQQSDKVLTFGGS